MMPVGYEVWACPCVWCVSVYLVVLVCAGHGGQGSEHTPSSCTVLHFAEARTKQEGRGRTRCGNVQVLSPNRFACVRLHTQAESLGMLKSHKVFVGNFFILYLGTE